MKKYIWMLVAALCVLASCKDDETYAEQKEKERKCVMSFMKREPILLRDAQGDTLLYLPKINVISLEQFEQQDSTTNVENNEFVLHPNSGVYMQIVRRGAGETIKQGETKRVICRYWEYNLLGDSLQSANNVLYWATNPDILDVANSSGTISASFNIAINGGGAMYARYKSTAVPQGWLAPLNYVKLGRQKSGDEGIAKVRLVVPHSAGTNEATTNVYPCLYEITYQEMK